MDSQSYNVVQEIIEHRGIASTFEPVQYGHLKLVTNQKRPDYQGVLIFQVI